MKLRQYGRKNAGVEKLDSAIAFVDEQSCLSLRVGRENDVCMKWMGKKIYSAAAAAAAIFAWKRDLSHPLQATGKQSPQRPAQRPFNCQPEPPVEVEYVPATQSVHIDAPAPKEATQAGS